MPPRRSGWTDRDPRARGFLDDVIAHPEDDAPRLIFADWLEDHDQPDRADFIRKQIELESLPEKDSRRKRLEKAANGLLRRFAAQWFAPPAGWKLNTHFKVRCGFPWSLTRTSTFLFEQADTLFSHWPIVHLSILGLSHSNKEVERLASWPYLARIRDLGLYNNRIGTRGISLLVQSPHLANVVSLDAGGMWMGDEGARLLAEAPVLAGLRELDIRHNDIGPAGMAALIESSHRRQTTSLGLCGNTISAEDAIALLESPNWPALTDLTLWNTNQRDEGVRKLASCPALAKLTALNLNLSHLTDEGLQALAESPHAANLRSLLLAVNDLTSRCGDILIGSPSLRGLTRLNLYKNRIHWRTRHRLQDHFGDAVSFDEPW